MLKYFNETLAGETFMLDQAMLYFDKAIDDINDELNTEYPSISDFLSNRDIYVNFPEYNFFPDKYIRTVLIPGAAYKFYIIDEEGIDTAPAYRMEFQKGLFRMLRDYSSQIPAQFRAQPTGFIDCECGYSFNNVGRFFQ